MVIGALMLISIILPQAAAAPAKDWDQDQQQSGSALDTAATVAKNGFNFAR